MSKNYKVTIYYEGSIDYDVEADSEEEAKSKAEELFANEDSREVQGGVLEQSITGCYESEE